MVLTGTLSKSLLCWSTQLYTIYFCQARISTDCAL